MAEHPTPSQPDARPPGRPAVRPWLRWWKWIVVGLVAFAAWLGLSKSRAAVTAVEPLQEPRPEEVPLLPPPSEEEEIRYADGRIEHPKASYERKDIHFRALLAVLVAGACVVALILYSISRFYWSAAAVQQEAKRSPYPLAPAPSLRLPPEPRLEQLNRMAGVEGTSVWERQLAKERILHSYGTTDEKGFVHVPIQEAMKTLADQLSKAKPPQAAKDRGLLDAGESNSGRMFREALK